MKEDIIKLARLAGAHDNGWEVRFVEPKYLEQQPSATSWPSG